MMIMIYGLSFFTVDIGVHEQNKNLTRLRCVQIFHDTAPEIYRRMQIFWHILIKLILISVHYLVSAKRSSKLRYDLNFTRLRMKPHFHHRPHIS